MRCFVTGATGFIGGRLAATLAATGHEVRALVRDPDRAAALERSGVSLVAGDIADPTGLSGALSGAERVFHCAGLVGDWLDHDEARRVNVEGTRALLGASVAAGVERFVHLSSLSVYGLGQHCGTDETSPLRYSGDAYIDSKIDAERMVAVCAGRDGLDCVTVRPGFVYGPGDRRFLPKLLGALAAGRFVYVGDGSKLLNLSYVDDVAGALLLAGSVPAAAGRAYNIVDGTETSLRDFVELLCDRLGLPRPTRRIAVPVGRAAAWTAETVARARRAPEAPRLSRGRLRFLAYNQHYSGARAETELGYRPRVTYREGLPPTLAWYRDEGLLPEAPSPVPAPPGAGR